MQMVKMTLVEFQLDCPIMIPLGLILDFLLNIYIGLYLIIKLIDIIILDLRKRKWLVRSSA